MKSASSSSQLEQSNPSLITTAFWRRVSEQRYWAASALLVTAMLLRTFYGEWRGDFWEHSAVVRELARHPAHPSHPLLNVDAAHPFFSPYLLLVAGSALRLSISPISALALAGMANLVLLLVGLRLFIQVLFKHDQQVVAFYALALTLFAWPASAWTWSGFYHFGVLGFVLPYPSTFAMALTFLILALHTNCLQGWHVLGWATTTTLTAVVLLTHPPTALGTLVGIGAVTLAETRRCGYRAWAIGAGVVSGAVLLALLWPYYSFWELVTRYDPDLDTRSYVLYSGIRCIWPTLLLLPIAAYIFRLRLRANRLDALVMMTAATTLIYLFGYISGRYGIGRVISFAAMFVQFGAAALAAQWEGHPRVARSWLAPVMVLFSGVLAVNPNNKEMCLAIAQGVQGLRFDYSAQLAMGRTVPQDAVILADLETSWMLPTFAGKVVASRHPVHWVADHKQRRADLDRFFRAETGGDERQAVLIAYRVDYVLIDTRRTVDPRPFLALGRLTAVIGQFLVIAVTDHRHSESSATDAPIGPVLRKTRERGSSGATDALAAPPFGEPIRSSGTLGPSEGCVRDVEGRRAGGSIAWLSRG
jgi:alpha-1,6-mannosyltransferase